MATTGYPRKARMEKLWFIEAVKHPPLKIKTLAPRRPSALKPKDPSPSR